MPDKGLSKQIDFISPGGSIHFSGGDSIVGLTKLTVAGVLDADQITVGDQTVAISAPLYAMNQVLGNVADIPKTILGGNAALVPNGGLSMSHIGVNGEKAVNDAIKSVAQSRHLSANGQAAVNVKTGSSVDLSNDDDGNIIAARTYTDSVVVNDSEFDPDFNHEFDGLYFGGDTGEDFFGSLKTAGPVVVTGKLKAGDASTGKNLRVDSDGQSRLSLVMARNLTDLDSITINNGGPVISGGGIHMGGKKITSLAAGTDTTDAVNVAQLNDVADVASAGWHVSVGGEGVVAGNKVAPGGTVDFNNTDGNISIMHDGTDLAFNLNKDLDLSSDGSLTTGNTVVNNDGLTVDDGVGNKTATTAAGTTISNATGDKTTVGAGSITVADAAGNSTSIGSTQLVVGGANPVTINGDTGRIGGLTNTMWDPDNYTSGQAATEDQLKRVSDVASAGWNVTDAQGNSANIGPNGQVAFAGDNNITVEQTGTENDGQLDVKLNKDIDLGADGSLTTGDTAVNNAGVAVGSDVHLGSTGLTINNGPSITLGGINAGDLRITQVAAGINATDAANYGQLQPIESFIGLDGSGSFAYNGGQYRSLKDALDSLHWNVEAPAPGKDGGKGGGADRSGSTGGGNAGSDGDTSIHNGNTVGFVEGDNIVISKTDRVNDAGKSIGTDVRVAVSQDLNVNSITAVNVQADEIQISNGGGPIINENGIDMSGKQITNVAAGVNETDAVNVGQLYEVAGNLQGQVTNLRRDVNSLDKRLSAGVAAAMATAALPQAYLPGKHMMSMAGGTWHGESGMAIGFSGITDNGRWIYKLSGNSTSRGDYGGAVGVGYQW